eukprot:TRINITY_DN4821_c0_g2_i4.p1 TRINITY_DN4821_c0_g2~~TRINITY_DN4821_c0_g2_i4.p1  ORF type:complete len:1096 (-),score=196.66 TRINITY_DN4821_c0_g2_i4:1002-4250(-)
MADSEDKFSRNRLLEWQEECGVKQISKEYDKLAEMARSNERSLQEELKAQNKDWRTFSKECDRFDLLCWPTEFKELGSGYVLYFHFLAFLMLMFVVLLGLQAPVMAAYAGKADFDDWYWHDWTKGYGVDVNACKCIGNETGFAATCGAWDRDLCSNPVNCPYKKPGRWICQKWCYASQYCPTKKAPDPSMTNVHVKGGLVKAYSACEQDKSILQTCEARPLLAKPEQYQESDIDVPPAIWTSSSWMSPGNFGPDEANDALIPTLYTVCVISLCVMTLMAYSSQVLTDHKIDQGITSPNDFAIMVKGFSEGCTDEEAIKRFFEEHAVTGQQTEVVKVVIGWDFEEYRGKIAELKALNDKKTELKSTEEVVAGWCCFGSSVQAKVPDAENDDAAKDEVKKIEARMNEITADLGSIGSKDSHMKSSGVAIVSFRRQSDHRACLEKWTSFWARNFYSEAADLCPGFCWRRNGILKGDALAKFPIGGTPMLYLSVVRAANPGDINWSELGVGTDERRKRFLYTNAVMFLLSLLGWGIIYGLRKVSDMMNNERSGLEGGGKKDEDADSSLTLVFSILPALVVAVVNGLIMIAARYLGEKEFHDTITEQEFSKAAKMTVCMILNTAGVILFQFATPQEWYMAGGLVDGVWIMLLVNAIVPPVVPYIDIGYKIRCCKRRQLTDESIQKVNEGLQSKDPKIKREALGMEQYWKKAWAPSEMNVTRRYANAMKTFICCLLYMPVMPVLGLVGIVGLFMQYWIDKYLLLRWNVRPPKPQNADMANFFVRFIKLVGPVGFSVAFFLFLTPSYDNKELVLSNFLVSIAVAGIFSFVFPLSVWVRCWLVMPCNGRDTDSLQEHEDDYYQAQHMWAKEMKYHKDQFIYKRLPEAKNPEMLTPGAPPGKVEDMQESYGASAAGMADEVADGGRTSVVLKGGRVLGAGSVTSSAGPAAAAKPAPTTFGAVSSTAQPEPVAPVASGPVVSGIVAPAEPFVEAAGHAGHAAEPSPPRDSPGGKISWQFQRADGHFTAFNADCQSYIEKRYQGFLADPHRKHVNVDTKAKGGKITVSIDFERMTSKVKGKDPISAIKRVESE